MIKRNTDSKSMIKEFYEIEKEADMDQTLNLLQAVTVRMGATHLCMLNAISKRFGQTRSHLMKEIIEHEITNMFDALSESDKQALAVEADIETTKLMREAGHTITTSGILGSFENEWKEWETRIATQKFLDEKFGDKE